jgi:hypothetical protein
VEPRRSVLTPDLERWLARTAEAADRAISGGTGEPTADRRTVVVRLVQAADPERAAARLREAGASVQTTAAASVIAVVTADVLGRVLADAEPWIVAIEEPRRLFPSIGRDVDR